MNSLTIIALVVIGTFALIGHHRGFIRMLLSIISLALTLYLATLISPYISSYLQGSALYDSVYDGTYSYVSNVVNQSAANTMDGIMDELQLPEMMKKYVEAGISTMGNQIDVAAVISSRLAATIFDVLVFIVTFVAATIVVKLIIAALDIVSHLPVIHGLNQIAGLVAGIAEGLVFVWIFFVILGMMNGSDFAVNIYTQINESPILTALYNHNIIMNALFR